MQRLRRPVRVRSALCVGLGWLSGCGEAAPAPTPGTPGALPAGEQTPGTPPSSIRAETPGSAPSPSIPEQTNPNVSGAVDVPPNRPAASESAPLASEPMLPTGCAGADAACLPAFPGADGAGAFVTGGRGGDVYHVTLLDTDSSDMRPGTLRFGLTNVTSPRTIVFDVSGVFRLGRTAVAGWTDNGNGWDTSSRLNIPANVTIAGQTAPGPVLIMGGVIKAGGENFILRNVTVAPGYGTRGFDEPGIPAVTGDFPDTYVFDAIDISGRNLIIDHVSTLYATDETISMNEEVDNVTIQYSSISQGQNYPQADAEASGVRYTGHALGSLAQGGSNAKVSVHHNLYAHQKGRLPRVGTEADALTVPGIGAFNDFRSNVFYNWYDSAGTGASGQPSQTNFVANFYLSGPGGVDPSGGASTALAPKSGGTSIFDGNDALNTKVFHSGNLKDTNLDGDALDGIPLGDADFPECALQTASFAQVPYAGVTEAADVAFGRVLDYAGSRFWERSASDQRIVAEVRAGTGAILAWADDPFDANAEEGAEWRALASTATSARAPDFDSDADGMPDAWESEHGLAPATADNNDDFDADGYTNLEEYINEIAAWPAPTPAVFSGAKNRRYALIQNWSLAAPAGGALAGRAPWQPSRYDTAQILSGVVQVDAVGQHAGTLELASADGVAVLEVRAGGLDVARALYVGASAGERARVAGSGQVQQSGGRVRVGRALVLGGAAGASAEYDLLGGVLSARRLQAAAQRAFFNFVGGTLHADEVGFDLSNQGGVLWPGRLTRAERERNEPRYGALRVRGDLHLASGSLHIALGSQESDSVLVDGNVVLGGTLELEPRAIAAGPEDEWVIVSARGSIRGAFERVAPGFDVRISGSRVSVVRRGWPSIARAAASAAAAPVALRR